MTADLIAQINDLLGDVIQQYQPLSGGDISSLYHIQTATQSYVLKLQAGELGSEMLRTERLGLAELAAAKSIAVPRVYQQANVGGQSILLMDYIESRNPKAADHTQLGLQLAQLHQYSSDTFGWNHNNFIGRLPQSNQAYQDWVDFYAHQRLIPQLALAERQNLLSQKKIPTLSQVLTRCSALCPIPIKPALLHGDLWSGNYLIGTDDQPYLIDPAVYYGHAEVDLAMSRLFGGFGSAFYEAYHSIIPAEAGWEERVDLYQLYYLLVHLNMFGISYRKRVLRILQSFS